MVNQIEATSFKGQCNGGAEPVVVVPYGATAPYPRDVVCISNDRKKHHTGLIATIIGLAAAGGTFYLCKGKDMPEIQKGVSKFFKDFKKSVGDLFTSKASAEEKVKAETAAKEARTPDAKGAVATTKGGGIIADKISHSRHYIVDEMEKAQEKINEIEGKLGINWDTYEYKRPEERTFWGGLFSWLPLHRPQVYFSKKVRMEYAKETLGADRHAAYTADLKAQQARLERLRTTAKQLNEQEVKFNKNASNVNAKALNKIYNELLQDGMPAIEQYS